MKLLSVHIENFGILSNKSFDFSDGLNTFCEENGWGKSTLSAFIKVMFYGFDNERVRDENENERKKYRPWQGGTYGGSIRFKTKDKVYRLNRTFGAKESEDEFLLVDAITGMASKDYTEQIGEEIFGIDAAAFKRTVFLAQNDCMTKATDSINAKMGNLNDVSDDLNCYENVMKKLKDEMNALSPTRATGSIHKLQYEITESEKKLQSKKIVEEQLKEHLKKEEEYKEEREALKEQSKILNKIQLYISENSVRVMKAKTLAQFKEKEDERKQECDKLREHFSGNVPSTEDLKEAFEQAGELRVKGEALRVLTLSEREAEDEKKALEFFEQVPYQENVYQKNAENIDKFYEVRNRYEKTLFSKEERDKLDEYSVKYSESNFRTLEVEELEKVWSEVETRRNSLLAKKEAHSILETEERQGQKTNNVSPVMFILPLVAFLVAAGVLITFVILQFVKPYLIISGVVTGVFLLLTLFLFIRWNKRRKEKPIFLQSEMMKTQIVEEEQTIKTMENNIVMRLETKGLINENEELSKCFWRIKNEFNEFGELKRRREQVKNDVALEELIMLSSGIDSYLKLYLKESYEAKDLSVAINRLFAQNNEDVTLLDARRAVWMNAMEQIDEYSKKCKEYKEKRDKYENSKKEEEEIINNLHKKFDEMGIIPAQDMFEQLKNLQTELQSYTTACEEYDIAKKEREEFEKTMKEEADSEMPEGWEDGMTAENCEQKQNQISEKMEDIAENTSALRNMILYAQEQLDEFFTEEEHLTQLKEQKEELLQKYQILGLTQKMMEEAKNAFTATYIEPVSKSFTKYVKMLDEKKEYPLSMDAASNVTLDVAGLPRSDKAFSTGLQDLFGICKRMAFIETMYKDEKPMIVFDDPFTNLDEDKIAGGLKFLNMISQEYQVIYFTCHKDRVGENA